jgi:transposase
MEFFLALAALVVYKSFMTHEERAAALGHDEQSRKEILAILERDTELATRVAELERQLAWFQRQIFGSKSERRIDTPDARQLALGEVLATGSTPPPPSITIPSHSRHQPRKSWQDSSDDGDLRFAPSVPVQEIRVPNPEAETLSPSDYVVIGQKITCRLAQKPGAYVVLRYVRDVLKLRSTEKILCPPAPPAVIEKSLADVSFLAGLLVDKFLYHLPLYRQHQRLQDGGIRLARATLTNLVHACGALLEPIYQAQLRSILESQVLCMDETPIRAGREPGKKGKMQCAYFWPMYGDRDEVVFPFSTSRSLAVPRKFLKGFTGTLLTDGYVVYDRCVELLQGLRAALCWSHTRRQFVEAGLAEPELCARALDLIGEIYAHEDVIRERGLDGERKLEYRAEHSKPAVDRFFVWLRDTLRERILVPSNPLAKATGYALEREAALRVFLENPAVPVDTNHLEREIRPIAVGRKNWLFCWTEIGAEYVGVVQSLIRTCRLQGVDPYTYLVDVLQRVATHPATDVHLLTPRLWKEHFAANPMRSDLDSCQNVPAVATS